MFFGQMAGLLGPLPFFFYGDDNIAAIFKKYQYSQYSVTEYRRQNTVARIRRNTATTANR